MKKLIVLLSMFSIAVITNVYGNNGLKPEHLSRIKNVTEVSVSDNGNWIAYVLLMPVDISEGVGKFYRELYIYDVKKFNTIPLITGKVDVSGISWVPGKEEVSFRQVIEGGKGNQVFSIRISDKNITQLTDFPRPVNSYQFINANTIALTALQPHNPDKQRLLKQGFDLYVFEEELRHLELFRYNISTGEATKLVDNLTVFDFTVSPDGTRIAAAISEKNLVDYEYMFKKIHIIDATTGKIISKLNNQGKLEKMVWSPDSRNLAFLAASSLNDAVCGSLFVMDTYQENVNFEDLTNLVKGLELSVIDVIWEDNNRLLYSSEESVDITLTRYMIKEKKRETVISGGQIVFYNVSMNGGNLYFSGNTSQHPNELMHYDLRKKTLQRISKHNDPWLNDVSLARQEKITWAARDGKIIDGVLVYPLEYEEGKKYPVIVYIHGGPEACVKNGWNNGYSQWGQFAASRGFFVFSPNYRAGSGRGVEFTMAGYGDLLGAEYDDVLDGIDHLIKRGLADKDRIGIGGGSYGGFFAAWSATKHSERFAASVVFVGISNQLSKRKITDIPYEDYHVHWGYWTWENWKKVWDASPVKYVTLSQTPTLILHGDDDPRIPVSQGLELYRGLKIHGKAPVRFVRYPGEGHGNIKNINRYDYLVRTLEWFEFYLIKNPGSREMPALYIDYPVH